MRAFLGSLLCCLLLGGRAAIAQPRELLLFMEVPTVLTATGREQPITEAPSTITVITAEEIRQSGATSLPDLLRSVPGLDFFRTSASNVNIAARGLNLATSTRTQVLVDGLSVYEDVLGLIYWHQIPIPLEEIERIEIVRSPATALYGDKAFAGVIHIITKSPEALQPMHISQTVGEAGTVIGDLIYAGVVGKLSYKVSLGYDQTNQFPNPDVGRTSDEEGRVDKRAHFQVNYKLGPRSRASLSGGIDEFDRREIIPAGPFQEVVAGRFAFVKANYAMDDFRVQLSYNRFEGDFRSQSFLQDASAAANIYQAKLQDSAAVTHNNVLTGGMTYRFVTVDSPGLIGGSEEQHHLAYFLQDEWKLRENLTLTVGAGMDVHPEAGISLSPRASLVYLPWKDHIFRVSVAMASRNPSILENFESFTLKLLPSSPPKDRPQSQTITVRGNTNLKSEEMVSYEVGYQTQFFQRVKSRIDLFYNQLDRLIAGKEPIFSALERRDRDLLQATGVPLVPQPGQFFNAAGGKILGGELGFDVFLTSWLTGFVNYSYQDRKGNVEFMGFAPNHKGNVGLNLSPPNGLSATALVHYVGAPENPSIGVDPYTIVTTRLGYRFKVLGNETELAIQAFNLFNDVHREIPGGDFIERRVSGTVRVRF